MKLNVESAVRLKDADMLGDAILVQFGTRLPQGMLATFLQQKHAALFIARNKESSFFSKNGHFITSRGAIYDGWPNGLPGQPGVVAALITYSRGTALIQTLRSGNGHAACQQS